MASIALGIAALVNAGVGAYGADQQANASTDAAYTQSQGALSTIPITDRATGAAQQGLKDASGQANQWVNAATLQANQGLAPYAEAGANALGNLNRPGGPLNAPAQQFSFNPQDLVNDPGYQFTLTQGLQAVDRGAASRGMAASGGTAKSEEQYATGLAQNTFQNAFTRALSTFQTNQTSNQQQIANQFQLANLGYNASTQLGQNTLGAAQWTGNTALSTAQQTGNWGLQGAGLNTSAITGAANATAAGQVGSANAWANGLSNAGGAASNAAQMYTLAQLFKQGSTAG